MSSDHNRFEALFSDAESTNDVRPIFFSNCDGLSESELADLKEAHEAAFDRLSKAEFEVMRRLVGVEAEHGSRL